MATLWQDLKYGFRMLVKSPSFTVVAVLALALGIGVNTAIFSGVNAFILRPLPIEKPDELVILFFGSRGEAQVFGGFSYPDYLDFRDRNKVFSGLLAKRGTNAALGAGGSRGSESGERNEVIWGELVSGNYFEVLGVRPILGRSFLPEEDQAPGTHPVVVLSHNVWQRRFNSDPAIIGKTVAMNGRDFTIIGIAPQSFTGTEFALGLDFWAPMMMQAQLEFGSDRLTARGDHWLKLFGRLKPGVTVEQSEAEVNIIAEDLAKTYPATNENRKVSVFPEIDGRWGDDSATFKLSAGLAMAVVSLVLLIACANVANLLLARAAARRREIGIRLALGASRFRLIRQLLTESLLLALLGGALGLLLAFWLADLMHAFFPQLPFRIVVDLNLDRQALVWTLLASLLTGLLFGLAPALHASRPDLVPVLKGNAGRALGGGTLRRLNLRNFLVVAQVSISLVVLVCGGLFIKSFRNAGKIDPGFKTDNLLSMSLDPGLLGYTEDEGKRFYTELVERVETMPGVASASITHDLPLGPSSSTTGPITAEGQAPAPPGEGLSTLYNVIGTKHFETIGTPLVKGRDFGDRDRENAPGVVIINETMARRVFGTDQNPVGKRLRVGSPDAPHLEVVGVARDGRYRSLGETPRPYMYLPELQRYYRSQMKLLVRTDAAIKDPKTIIDAMRREVGAMDARLPVFDVKTVEEHLNWALWGTRMAATLSLSFGVLALLLAAMGIYSVMSYAVSQRTREIGIRMALGAQRSNVLRLVTRQGMILALVGVVAGLMAAFGITRVLESLLYGVGATDPLVFFGIAALLAAVAFVASFIPARRATKVDPMVALRYE